MYENRLNQKERDELLSKLKGHQREFFTNYLKRGRKTVFANVLAKEKASGVEGEDIELVASKWELIDFIDDGPDWRIKPKLFCECGRPLRYQYVVLNTETSEIKKFGISHFEEHVGIPPHLVRKIRNGIDKIDYEGDELLLKIIEGWTLEEEAIKEIPKEVEIPKDIQLHFDYEVPLLHRQVERLRKLINEYSREQFYEKMLQDMKEKEDEKEKEKGVYSIQREQKIQKKNLFANLELDLKYQAAVMVFLDTNQKSEFLASEVCEYLVDYHDAPKDRFRTGKLKIFPDVCLFLEHLVERGELMFLKRLKGKNRLYQVSKEMNIDNTQSTILLR